MKYLRNILTALILMLFIISFSVVFTLNFRPLYYFDIEHLNIESLSGMTTEDIKNNYDVLIDYNNMTGPDTLEFPTLPMSETGRIHFEEVKVIFVAIEYMLLITGILSIILILLHTKKFKEWLYLKLTAIFTIVIPAVLAVCIGINWDKAFVIFHKIFFNNDYWIFSADTDPVILMLPDTFFFHCAAMILILVVLGSVICAILHNVLKRRLANNPGITQ